MSEASLTVYLFLISRSLGMNPSSSSEFYLITNINIRVENQVFVMTATPLEIA